MPIALFSQQSTRPTRVVRGLPMPERPPADLRPRQRPSLGPLAVGAAVGFPIAVFVSAAWGVGIGYVALVARTFVVAQRLNRRIAAAVALLNERHFEAAEREFRQIASGCRRARRSVVLYNIAVCFLRTGRIEEALSVLCELEASKATRKFAMRRNRSSIQYTIAIAYLQLGHIDAADAWCAVAKKSPATDAAKNHLLYDALSLLRRQQYADADRFLTDNFRAIEGFLPAVLMRAWRVRHAFAAHSAGAALDRVQMLLSAAKPSEPGEYAPLAVGWPEFHAFLVDQGL
jgi:tetratricopeptide (TPR) repeat protein